MGALGAAVVGFVVGIAFALLLDEYLGFEGGLWDFLTILLGIAGALLGGSCSFESKPGGPTVISVHLPVWQPVVPAAEQRSAIVADEAPLI